MSDPGFEKCSCKHCFGHLEFPSEAAGSKVNCPHCGKETLLFIAKAMVRPVVTPDKSPADEPVESKPSARLRCGSCGARHEPGDVTCHNCGVLLRRSTKIIRIGGTLLIIALALALPLLRPKSVKNGKLRPDLELLGHRWQPTSGSKLVYVTGSVTNNSNTRYLSVKVEFDLLNNSGTSVGTTGDYLPVLEPHKVWNFKALVIDPEAVSAKPASLLGERHFDDNPRKDEKKPDERKDTGSNAEKKK